MRKNALKLSSILLCGLLIYNSLGHFLALTVMQLAVRQHTWAQLSKVQDDNLTTFIIAKNNPGHGLKVKNSHEIIVDGKLYDVVRKKDNGKYITYFCIRDQQEETLIATTRQFNSANQQIPLRNTARLIVEKIIKTATIKEDISSISESSDISFLIFLESHYSGPEIQIALPPPESFC